MADKKLAPEILPKHNLLSQGRRNSVFRLNAKILRDHKQQHCIDESVSLLVFFRGQSISQGQIFLTHSLNT